MKKVKRIRDVSLALAYAQLIEAHAEDGEYSPEINHNLVLLLTRLDARTGRRERGKGAALNPVAKKAGARRR